MYMQILTLIQLLKQSHTETKWNTKCWIKVSMGNLFPDIRGYKLWSITGKEKLKTAQTVFNCGSYKSYFTIRLRTMGGRWKKTLIINFHSINAPPPLSQKNINNDLYKQTIRHHIEYKVSRLYTAKVSNFFKQTLMD